MVRWCWVNFQCRGVLLIWIRVGQGPAALAVGAGGRCLDIFSLVYHFSFLSPSLWETARYRLKYCLKGPLSPKQQTNQPYLFVLARNFTCRIILQCSLKFLQELALWSDLLTHVLTSIIQDFFLNLPFRKYKAQKPDIFHTVSPYDVVLVVLECHGVVRTVR